MKVLLVNEVGGFKLSPKILEWIKENLGNPKYKIPGNVRSDLSEDIEYYKNNRGDKDIVIWCFCDYQLRSLPFLIDAYLESGSSGGRIEEIAGSYYKIIETDCGYEYLITPDNLSDFIKGYEN